MKTCPNLPTRYDRKSLVASLLALPLAGLQAATITAHFEDTGVSSNSYWNGNDLSGGIHSRWVLFRNWYNADWDFWSGVSISSISDTNTPGYGNQYAVWTPGTGYGGTGCYAVVYVSDWDPSDYVAFPFPVSLQGFYVNNTTYAALSMRDGDWFSKKFGGPTGNDPDWFRLTIIGKDRNGQVLGTVTVYLADYRFENNEEDYILSDWTWVDLSSLGNKVSSLRFQLESSDVGFWGMNTPAYFAMDQLTFVPSFSAAMNDPNSFDAPVPGFVGPAGDGKSGSANNWVNAVFAGWASEVISYNPAPGVAAQWTNAALALGPVSGNNMDITSLGDLDATQISNGIPPGNITLRMSTPIANKEGPDFTVFENGFISAGKMFAELAYVEVSSDGTNFARFPAVSLTTNRVGAYGTINPRDVYNLAGKHVNAYGNSWGTPFDLDDLAMHPLVTNGLLSLTNVLYVRLVDIPGSGDFFDSLTPSNPVYDAWVTWGPGGHDLEAVGVINSPEYVHLTVQAIGPGMVSPYGVPGGKVAVAIGSNATFSMIASNGYYLGNVRINGQTIGAASEYTFLNVTNPQLLEAEFGCRVTVLPSPHGSPQPNAGDHVRFGSSLFTMADGDLIAGLTRYQCTGWTGSGSIPASGNGTSVAAHITNDSAIAWQWQTSYWLSVSISGDGSVQGGGGWQPAGETVFLTATPDPYYEFRGWSGDVSGDTNALTVAILMNGPREVTANFGAETTVHGVPLVWLEAHGLTNGAPDDVALSDPLGKGMKVWEEFYAGTDPNDPHSLFQVVDCAFTPGSNTLTWTAGTNGSQRPFLILGSTNLLSGWFPLATNIARSMDGTNRWTHETLSPAYFYRIAIPTDP